MSKRYFSLFGLFLFWVGGAGVAHAEENNSILKNESALGLVITGGNSQAQSITVDDKVSYAFDLNTFKLNGNFLRTSNAGIESAYHWLAGARYERELEERISLFLGQNIESDRFQNILQRFNSDLGGKYFFSKDEGFQWFGEAGYRFTRTNYFNATFINDNYARFFTQAERAFNKSVSVKYWIEYLANLTESSAYKLNTEISLGAALSEVFSLRTAYLFRYDHRPAPSVVFKNDSTLTTALVAKF